MEGKKLLLLLLSCFSRVRLFVTPEMAAHQAPPSLGFSRQEHWSGLPFPSPMHESEKWKWSRSVATPWTAAHQAPPSMGFSTKEYWSGLPLPSRPSFIGSQAPLVFLVSDTHKCYDHHFLSGTASSPLWSVHPDMALFYPRSTASVLSWMQDAELFREMEVR